MAEEPATRYRQRIAWCNWQPIWIQEIQGAGGEGLEGHWFLWGQSRDDLVGRLHWICCADWRSIYNWVEMFKWTIAPRSPLSKMPKQRGRQKQNTQPIQSRAGSMGISPKKRLETLGVVGEDPQECHQLKGSRDIVRQSQMRQGTNSPYCRSEWPYNGY